MAYTFGSISGTVRSPGAISDTWVGRSLAIGDRAVLAVFKSSTETVTGITDSGSNTWTRIVTDVVASTERWSFFESAIVAAATSITVTYSAASTTNGPRFELFQASGLNQSIAGQAVANYQGTPTTATDATTSTALTPAAQPGVLVGYTFDDFAAVTNTGTGFTDRGVSAADASVRWEDKSISSTAAIAATYTSANNYPHVTLAVYWQEAASAATLSRVMYIG